MRARERTCYNYMGDQDNDHLNTMSLIDEEVLEQVWRILHGVEEKPPVPGELSLSVRPPQVSL